MATSDRRACKCWLLGVLMVFALATNGFDAYTTKVMTKYGLIRGSWTRSTRGRLVAHYLGVPYAEPPVGDLRFRSPRPWNRTWDGTFEAVENGPMCFQLDQEGNPIGSEDCLYLNIFVPAEQREENSTLPVMVHVHGGKYNTGSNDNRKLPPDYLMDQDIILVTINHRLNILGYLSTASKASPGNYGLKDIVMALRWIQENIASFNGDPNSVTLWGHSSGGAAVHILALDKRTEGLFNRYIIHSGNAFCPWAVSSKSWARKLALDAANMFDCLPREKERKTKIDYREEEKGTTVQPEATTEGEESDTEEEKEYSEQQEEEMIRCLKGVKIKEFTRMLNYYDIWKGTPCCPFGPVIEEESDDAVVTMHPLTAIKHHLFRDIPFIIGVVEDEGLLITIGSDKALDKLSNDFEKYLPYMLEYYQFKPNSTEFADSIEEFYFAGNASSTLKQNITELVSDALFIWPTYQTLQYQSEVMNSSIYFYLFSYEGTFTSTFSTGDPTHYGVAHIDDLNYLIPLLNRKHKDQLLHNTESDITIINIMTEMWASFAATGVPKAWRVPTWPDYKDSHEFLRFGIDKNPDLVIENVFFPERMTFWEELTANLTLHTAQLDFLIDPPDEEYQSNDAVSQNCMTALVYLSMLFIFTVFFYYYDNIFSFISHF